MEIQGVSAAGILGTRIYLRGADTFAPGQRRSSETRKQDGDVEETSARSVVDVIDLRTSEARRATDAQRRYDQQNDVLRSDPGRDRGAFLDISV